MSDRPPVPPAIKQQLRREAGFGCCKCGRPLYDYHHIVPYGVEHHFRPEDMMVLCPYCHREATVGVLVESEQRHYKANPYNLARGLARGALAINQTTLAVALGSNQFVGDGTFIRVDDQPLLSLSLGEDGRLELSVVLYDRDDNLLAVIEKNEWIAGDPYPWDLEYGGHWLIIRRKKGQFALSVDARVRIVSVSGNLWFKRMLFRIRENSLDLDGRALGPSGIHGSGIRDLCIVGGGLIATTQPQSLTIAPDPQFKRMVLVSWPEVHERVQRGVEAWAKLTGQPVQEG